MTGFTPYFANKIVDHCISGVAWTPPAKLYLQLHAGDPGSDGSANVAATNDRKVAAFSSAVGGQANLTPGVTWVSKAKESISHFSAWDALTSGNCLFTGRLEQSKNLFTGDTLELPALSVLIPPGA